MDRNVEYFQEDSNGLTIQNQKGQWISHWLSVWANGMKNDGLDVPGGSVVKNLPANTETQVQSLVREDPTCMSS